MRRDDVPIEKFRNLDDMRKALFQEGRGDGLTARIARLWRRSSKLSPRVYPRGVFRFRTLEEAQQARARVLEENVRRLHESRLAEGKVRAVPSSARPRR
jgi:hypothetical protein